MLPSRLIMLLRQLNSTRTFALHQQSIATAAKAAWTSIHEMDAAQLLQTIESATRACAGMTFPSEADRNIVITAARELMFALRPPAFTVLEIAKWVRPFQERSQTD